MRENLINQQQPFGHREDVMAHKSTMATPAPHSNANLGRDTAVGNNGRTVVESFADKNPGAYEQACKNRSNPFAFVGKEMPTSRVNFAERQTNAI